MIKFKNVFAWMEFAPRARLCGVAHKCNSEVHMIHKVLDEALKRSNNLIVIQSITIDPV